jgi:5-formyltetrahydrofolate cyclo-ligase
VDTQPKSREELRKYFRKQLKLLDQAELAKRSDLLCTQLITYLSKNPPRHLLAFVKHFPGEVDLTMVINWALDRGVPVYLPLMDKSIAPRFGAVAKGWEKNLVTGTCGVPEPTPQSCIELAQLNLATTVVLVPGLVFDRQGNRMGRGAGFYDRALAVLSRAEKIGICWKEQVVERVPTMTHDVAVDLIYQEEGEHVSTNKIPT